MKKIIVTLAVSMAMISWSNVVLADTSATTSAGAAITIADGTGGSGSNLTFNPSPGVVMSWQTTSNAYGITALNTSASDGNRNYYGVWSGYSGYFQLADPTTGNTAAIIAGLTAPGDPSGTSTPAAFAAMQAMGGGS